MCFIALYKITANDNVEVHLNQYERLDPRPSSMFCHDGHTLFYRRGPRSLISRTGTMLLLHDENGVQYDNIGWLKCFKAMRQAKQTEVRVSDYIKSETSRANK
jgi:hypothetical protein